MLCDYFEALRDVLEQPTAITTHCHEYAVRAPLPIVEGRAA